MSEVVYVSKSHVERKHGPVRVAHLPGESQPVIFSVHGAVAKHYKIDPATLNESHASTLDYVIAATAGWMVGTFGGALDARQIDASNGKLTADVTGEVEAEDGVLVIRRIHVAMRLVAPPEARPTVERTHEVYAMRCPLYRTLRKTIQLTSSFELVTAAMAPWLGRDRAQLLQISSENLSSVCNTYAEFLSPCPAAWNKLVWLCDFQLLFHAGAVIFMSRRLSDAASRMKIYLGFTVAGNRSSVEAAKKILGVLQSMGHDVLTSHLVREDAWDADRRITPQEIFARDMEWLAQCDLFIAEVSGSSFGLGFETGYLLGATAKKTILFYERSAEHRISLLITGNTHPNCMLVPYSRLDELEDLVRRQVSS